MRTYNQYINGNLVEGTGKRQTVLDPATNEVIAEYTGASSEQATEALEAAQKAFATWSKTSLDERVATIQRLIRSIESRKEELLTVLMAETGKTYSQAIGDYNQCINRLRFVAEECKRVYGVTIPSYTTTAGGAYHIIEKRPIGVVVGHVAWNFPLGNAALKIGPILASGCTGVVKPSKETPLATMILAEAAAEAQIPAGVLNIVTGSSKDLGEALNGSIIPRMITLIGSTASGREVMRQGATSIKKYSLELGGNAPVIVMPDADIEKTAELAVTRKTSNAGQVCICFNRFYVHSSVHEQFVHALEENLKQVKLGTGKDEGKFVMGPMITAKARNRMAQLIEDAVASGAKLVMGGEIPEDKQAGNWITPALLVDVRDDMRVSKEEIFGPIIAVQTYTDLDDVIRRANDTDCGLTSYAFGHDTRAIAKLFEGLEYGELYVNGIPNGVHLPHGGVKQSGLGCDNSFLALEEYYDMKRFSIIP